MKKLNEVKRKLSGIFGERDEILQNIIINTKEFYTNCLDDTEVHLNVDLVYKRGEVYLDFMIRLEDSEGNLSLPNDFTLLVQMSEDCSQYPEMKVYRHLSDFSFPQELFPKFEAIYQKIIKITNNNLYKVAWFVSSYRELSRTIKTLKSIQYIVEDSLEDIRKVKAILDK